MSRTMTHASPNLNVGGPNRAIHIIFHANTLEVAEYLAPFILPPPSQRKEALAFACILRKEYTVY